MRKRDPGRTRNDESPRVHAEPQAFILKFSLSTFLLVVTCLALACGWYFERSRNDQRAEQIIEGAVCWYDAIKLEILDTEDSAALASRIEHDQIRCVLTLFRRAGLVEEFNEFADQRQLVQRYHPTDFSMVDKYSASNMASDMLDTLGCSSPEQYFDKLSDMFGTEIYTEFQDDGEEHSAFKAFLTEALKSTE